MLVLTFFIIPILSMADDSVIWKSVARQSKLAPAFKEKKSIPMTNRGPNNYGLPLNPDDFESGRKLQDKDIKYRGNKDPTEGDIVVKNEDELSFRNAIANRQVLWPGGRIPYVISGVFDERDRSVIARSMDEFHKNTCVRFVPRISERNYLYINRGEGCFSMIGISGGQQEVSLGPGCVYVGVVVHELMHATGFFHEQSRADRDDYVVVNWGNIIDGMQFNFLKMSLDVMNHLNTKYDYSSIMHYGPTSFSKDDVQPTILPKQRGAVIGQREGFSPTDIIKINKLYKCSTAPGEITKETDIDNEIPDGVSCSDSDKHCAAWASMGECAKNPEWMLSHCVKSCKQCGGTCLDDNPYCGYWAEKNECSANPSYMLINCQKSCGTCKKKSGSCKDTNSNCQEWASKGKCQTQAPYMREFCSRSCKMC